MSSDASQQENLPGDRGEPVPPDASLPEQAPTQAATEEAPSADSTPRRRILIGSQRDPAAYRPKPKRDWVSRRDKRREREKQEPDKPSREREVRGSDLAGQTPQEPEQTPVAEPQVPANEPVAPAEPPVVLPVTPPTASSLAAPPAEAPIAPPVAPPTAAAGVEAPGAAAVDPEGRPERRRRGRGDRQQRKASLTEEVMKSLEEARGVRRLPRPSVRDRLSPELEEEFQQALADVPLDALMAEGESIGPQGPLEPESRHTARVVAVQRDDVFLDLGGKEQGTLPVSLLTEPPQVGAAMEVVVVRFNPEDGLYELTLPGMAFEVGDWSQVTEGMLVEARVTGHNAGGLECEVSRIRGFIPISQIALYRVENLEEFKDQKLTCLVTEANPARRNLVLSRRAVLEREREEARAALLESLVPGQIREGVVRKLMDFGAFVDLGGIEGLLHVSQMAWGRVGHPREVLQEGQTIRVRVDKVNAETGRISLGYREMLESPWTNADGKYLLNTVVRGRVVKIMDFGAFVELEPGVEGLVHISEVSYKRIGRVSDVVKEGEEVDVMVLSVDTEAQRISLSMKAALHPPEPESTPEAQAAAGPGQPPPPPKPKRQPQGPLQGGLGKSSRGQQFGLKW